MTKDEMNTLMDIAKSLEHIAEELEEVSLNALCKTCYYRNFPPMCKERKCNYMHGSKICYSKERDIS